MEYQKIIYLRDNEGIQPSKIREKSWVETNENARGIYNINSQIKFNTTTLKVLRNRILLTILVRLLICLIRLCVSLHFL